METGRVEALWIKRMARGPMDPAEVVRLVEDAGIEGNADQGGWRQVTVIEREVFDRLKDELDPSVEPSMRRANVMVSGVHLDGTRGKILRLGDTRIHLRGETVPCERMDEAVEGLRDALKPETRGGMYGRVIAGGELRIGDEVALEDGPENG